MLQLKRVNSVKKQFQWKLLIEDHDAILENLPLAHFILVDEQGTLIIGLEHRIFYNVLEFIV